MSQVFPLNFGDVFRVLGWSLRCAIGLLSDLRNWALRIRAVPGGKRPWHCSKSGAVVATRFSKLANPTLRWCDRCRCMPLLPVEAKHCSACHCFLQEA